jgi:hypothetical protein
MASILDELGIALLDEALERLLDEADGLSGTSRTIVRTGIAQYFGGTTFDPTFQCYRGGPLLSSGLSTVRAYQPKRFPDSDYVWGLTPGRGMGAVMILEMPRTLDTVLTISQQPAGTQGQRKLVYPVRCHVFHMAHQDYAETAEADVDNLDQALHEHIYSDTTLGGICYQAGINSTGISTTIDPSALWKEITVTHFEVRFDAELQIIA